MKIVLLNPNNPDSRNDGLMKDFVGTVPPYGLLVIASVLRNRGHQVYLIDQYTECTSKEELVGTLKDLKPDVLGISVLAPVFGWVKEICLTMREVFPGLRIVMGNSFSSIFHKEILGDGLADIVVHGEGELTLSEYIDSLEGKSGLSGVQGISYRQNGSIVQNTGRQPIGDLDSLPYPDWGAIDLEKYDRIPMLSLYGKTAMIQGSRGCTYSCFYCSQDKVFKAFRTRKLASIAQEIGYIHDRYNVSNFIFLDAFFPFSVSSGMEFCDELIKRKLHKQIRWLTETKVDLVNRELLFRMKEAGLYLIMYGFETGSERILKMINKHTSLQKAHEVMRHTKDAGIRSLGLFMMGFPGETEQECRETISFSKRLGCDLVKYNLLTPYPGTGLYDGYVEDKLIAYKRPELFTSWYMFSNKERQSFNFSKMDFSTLSNIQRFALLSYYVRPKAIYNTLIKRIVRIDAILKAVPILFLNLVFLFQSGFAKRFRLQKQN